MDFTFDQEIGVINILIMPPPPPTHQRWKRGHNYCFGADPARVRIVATLCCVQDIMN